jgi:Fe2+ or Zn2+ uptake regulation protein
MIGHVTSSSVDRQVEGRLRRHGVRYTSGRRALVGALATAEGPRSAAELHSELAEAIPLSSLYRSLTVLEEAGVLAPHHGTRGLTRYEMAEWLTGHHHHLVCVGCGAVEDIEIPDDHELRLRDLIADVCTAASFAPSGHSLEIEGRCVRCA